MMNGETLEAFDARMQAEHAARLAAPQFKPVSLMSAQELAAFEVAHGLRRAEWSPRPPMLAGLDVPGARSTGTYASTATPPAPATGARRGSWSSANIAAFEAAHGIRI